MEGEGERRHWWWLRKKFLGYQINNDLPRSDPSMGGQWVRLVTFASTHSSQSPPSTVWLGGWLLLYVSATAVSDTKWIQAWSAMPCHALAILCLSNKCLRKRQSLFYTSARQQNVCMIHLPVKLVVYFIYVVLSLVLYVVGCKNSVAITILMLNECWTMSIGSSNSAVLAVWVSRLGAISVLSVFWLLIRLVVI